MSIDAMKQALDALEDAQRHNYALKHKETDELITVLRAAIEQAQPELVCVCGAIWEGQELVSTPRPRQWQGLTEAEKVNVAIDCGCADVAWMDFADAIEAKLREKNHG